MRFNREKATPNFFNEALPLFLEHHKEISHFSDLELNIDFNQYLFIEQSDALRIFTARDEENKLLGYASFIISKHIHYKDMLVANQTAIFIHAESRGFGVQFIKFCNSELKKEGVSIVTHRVTKNMDYAPILLRNGFEFLEVSYSKDLTSEVA